MVSKDTFTFFADEPQHHYMRAFENFIKHDWAAVIKVMDDSRHIAGKLIEGADWAKDEIDEAIEYLGREIEKLGKTVTAL